MIVVVTCFVATGWSTTLGPGRGRFRFVGSFGVVGARRVARTARRVHAAARRVHRLYLLRLTKYNVVTIFVNMY